MNISTLCYARIWALSNIKNEIRRFGVKFEVELYEKHERPIYHLKAYNFRIAIMKNNSSSLGSNDLGHVTPSLMEISLKFLQFSIKRRIKGLNICLREKCIIDELLCIMAQERVNRIWFCSPSPLDTTHAALTIGVLD